MPKVISTVAGFRAPWTQGAHAYPEADTFAAAKEGFKRTRKARIFHMPNTGEAGEQVCIACGNKLRDIESSKAPFTHSGAPATPDKNSTWTYDPSTKSVTGGMHYGCSWGALLTTISQIRSY